MTIGALDTDSAALGRRLELQEKLSAFDLNEWIFSQLPPRPGQHWLDLGCGRGKQSIPLAKAGCLVTSVDLSAESLSALRQSAENQDVGDRIRTVCSDLDSISETLDGEFDRVIGSYSLYYAQDAAGLFGSIRSLLKPDGELFFCGPSRTNNRALRELISGVTGKHDSGEETAASRFMTDAERICRRLFAHVEVATFTNDVTFPSADELLAYWRNHNLFSPDLEKPFAEAVAKAGFPFVNQKTGIGIRCHRPAEDALS